MHRSCEVDGVCISFKRSIIGWVACLGADYFVYFRQPIKGGVWVARRPVAQENICHAESLIACVKLAIRHYQAIEAERKARMDRRIAEAFALLPR